jgi:alpha-tubulin suppressor-like RCC1 family protein
MSISMNAQPSTICDGAIAFANPNSCFTNQTMSTTSQWYSYVADGRTANIQLQNLNAPLAHVHRMEAYSGVCIGNNLTLMDSISVTSSNDTLLQLNLSGLVIGNTYYIKLIRDLAGCVQCQNTAQYTLCLSSNAGNLWSLFLCDTGIPKSAGRNYLGQLGDGIGYTDRASLSPVTGVTNAIAVSAGGAHGLALLATGTVMAWGYNAYGQVGDATTTNRLTAVPVSTLTNVVAISAGNSHSLALKSDGTVWSWGSNSKGQLGVSGYHITPVQVTVITNIVAISAGADFSMALKNDGTVWVWGTNNRGQFGNGTISYINTTPVQVTSIPPMTAISAGSEFSIITNGTTIYASGNNSSGQLGNNLTTDHLTFIPTLGSYTGITALSAGDGHALALLSTGNVLAWGYNFTGAIGNGTNIDQLIPQVISGLTNVFTISGGNAFSIAVLNDGTARSWGDNGSGALALGTFSSGGCFCYTTPQIVSTAGCVLFLCQKPIMTNLNSFTLCSGNTLNIPLTSDISATYSWIATPNSNVTGESTLLETTTTINNTLINTTAIPQTVIYTVTPTSTSSTCLGNTQTITVVVNPTPLFTITGSTTPCAGTPPNYSAVPVLPILGTTYTWVATSGGTTLMSGIGNLALYSFPSSGGTITFTAITPQGCSFTTSLYVGSCCSPPTVPTFTNKNTTAVAYLGTTSGTTTTLVNQTIAINGTFTVNTNLVLKGCTLLMGYNAKINVNPATTLTVTSNTPVQKSHLYACNEMWDGIYITSPSCVLIINNGSTIEDALNAIVSENKGLYQISSSAIYGNVIFNKNYKSIVVNNALLGTHPAYVRSTTIKCYDGIVGGNPAITLNKLHYPHATERSYEGIELNNINNINIGNPTVLETNTFDNMDFGINSSNSSLTVLNNNFININYAGIIPKGVECVPGTGICAKGGKTVLRTLNVGSTSIMPFYRNTFTNDNRGIVATQYMNVNILKNTFTTVNTGIRLSKNYTNTLIVNENIINNARTSIDCYDNLSANVTMDYNTTDAGTLLNASGIVVQELLAGTTIYRIDYNVIKNVRLGIFGSGIKNSFIYNNNVYMKHTTVPTQLCYGIRLTNSSQCNVVSNWIQGTNANDYWVQGISLDVCFTDYVVCNESHNLGTGMFFGGVQTPNTFIAKNLMDNNYRGLVLNYGIVGDQFTTSTPNKPNDNRWTGSFTSGCYTEAYFSNGNFSQFFVRTGGLPYNVPLVNNCATTTFTPIPFIGIAGNLDILFCPSISGGFAPNKPLLLQIANNAITPLVYDAPTRTMLKQSLYQYLKLDPSTISTEPSIALFRSSNAVGNIGKLDDVETVLSNPLAITPTTLMNVQALNNAVTPTNDVETNSKWMNNLLIENALTGNDYTSAQISDLQVLAQKCPYNDGSAVYQARAILSQLENIEYMNPCELAYSSAHSMTSYSPSNETNITKNNEYKLFPNPNDGSMNFMYSLNEDSKGEMTIYDIAGKLVATYALLVGENNQVLINETKLNNGIYFYKVIVDNELKASDKIVIIK